MDVTRRPTHKPTNKAANIPTPDLTPAPIDIQPLGQSKMVSFDEFFDVLNEHDRHDELLFMAVTQRPTKRLTNKPSKKPTPVRFPWVTFYLITIVLVANYIFIIIVTNRFAVTLPDVCPIISKLLNVITNNDSLPITMHQQRLLVHAHCAATIQEANTGKMAMSYGEIK
jgi:hypothetical protein